ATYNTNQLKYELYSIIGIIDDTGFPISYLYIANGKNRDIRMIITNFTQISSAQAIWKGLNIQLCKWHVLRIIEQKLASITKITTIRYDSNAANNEALLRKEVLEYIELHFHNHMLIPTAEKEFVNSSKEIWLRAVLEYLTLFVSLEVSVIHTTMSIESHWRMLRRNYLYKFNQPRIDLVCYILTEKLLPVQLHRFQLLLHERILLSWHKEFKTEWNKLTTHSIKNVQ
ncbi:39295_t:CDS:2, partial [Gigaspora margarita]